MPVDPYTPLYLGGPPVARMNFLESMPASAAFTHEAAWEEFGATATTTEAFRTLAQQEQGKDFSASEEARQQPGGRFSFRLQTPPIPTLPTSPILSQEEAQTRLAKETVTFDIPAEGMRESTFNNWVAREHQKRRYADAVARGPQGLGETLLQFGIGLSRQFIDPINLTSAVIPIIPNAFRAAMLTKAGTSGLARAGVYARVGAAEGAVGTAALEPAMHYFADQLHEDYTMADSLLNIAFGGLIGGGLHVGIGAVGDWRTKRSLPPDAPVNLNEVPAKGEVPEMVSRLSPQAREDLGRMALAQALSGREIDIAAALDMADIAQKAHDQEVQPGFLKSAEDLLAQRQLERLRAVPGFLQTALDKLALREVDAANAATLARIDERISGESQQQLAQLEDAHAQELAAQIKTQDVRVTAKNLADLLESQAARAELLTAPDRLAAAAKDRNLPPEELRAKIERLQAAGANDLATYKRAGLPIEMLEQLRESRARAGEGVHQAARAGQAPDAGIPREDLTLSEEVDRVVKESAKPEGEKASVKAMRDVQDAETDLKTVLQKEFLITKTKDEVMKELFKAEDAAIAQVKDDTTILAALAQCQLRKGV